MMLGRLILLKKKSIFDLIDKYIYWQILKFNPIAKKTRFIFKKLAKMIIKNGITA